MSKRHQANRRRTYGRRQHEVRERIDRAGRWDTEPGELLDEGGSVADEHAMQLADRSGLRDGWLGAS